MVVPALDQIDKTFEIGEGVEMMMVMSIFMLGYAVGPFLLGPLSETYGRVKVMQGANLFYLIFNIACGFSQSKNQLLVFRFLSGMGGAAPQAVRIAPSSMLLATNIFPIRLDLWSLTHPRLAMAISPTCGPRKTVVKV
jgi:MFS family permease